MFLFRAVYTDRKYFITLFLNELFKKSAVASIAHKNITVNMAKTCSGDGDINLLADSIRSIFRRIKRIKVELEEVNNDLANITGSDSYVQAANLLSLIDMKPQANTTKRKRPNKCTAELLFEKEDATLDFSSFNVDDIDTPILIDDQKKVKVTEEIGKYEFDKENDYVIVYTDGACENNGKPNAKAGIGVWFGEKHPLNLSKPVDGKATNNTAEIQACIHAVHIAHRNGITKLKIKTDSQFTINCITQWIRRWKKNNWKVASGSDVKNKEDLVRLDTIIGQLAHVEWEHVRGHSGEKGNEEADKLARQGALLYIAH